MKVVMYASDKPREHMIAEAIKGGILKHGDTFEIRRTQDYGDDRKYEGPTPDTDVACVFGVKGVSRRIVDDHLLRGRSTVYLDKGYTREKGEAGHTLYSRAVVNGADATPYFQREKRSGKRFDKWDAKIESRKNSRSGFILFVGSSQKYHDFHRIGDATEFAKSTVRKLRHCTDRTIVYRPKPSWRDAVPIEGALYSHGKSTFEEALRGCYCVVTHGSNAAVHAILAGIPCMILGEGVAKPVSAREIVTVEKITWADDAKREQWAHDIAWTQFTADEFRNGMAWELLRDEIEHQRCNGRTISDSLSSDSSR